MFCTQCGTATTETEKFCANCGAPVRGNSNLDTPSGRTTAFPPETHRREANGTESLVLSKRPMHLAAYLGLCFGAWLVGAIVAYVISFPMGNIYARATAATVIGFWLGKVVLRNKRRHWSGVVAFPIITFIAALIGWSLGLALVSQNPRSVNYSAFISLAIAFALSCGLFAISNIERAR